MCIRDRSSCTPKLYGLPKIHKADIPLRPIVSLSTTGSPTQNLAYSLSEEFQTLAEKMDSYIKNLFSIKERLSDFAISSSYILVIFEVMSLFNNISILEALQIITASVHHGTNKALSDLHPLCVATANALFYWQIDGAPVGSRSSLVIAYPFPNLEKKPMSTS